MRVNTFSALALGAAGSSLAQNATSNSTTTNSTAPAFNATAQQIAIAANLEHFWSYGRSPPVYPTPQGSGVEGWAFAYTRAQALVQQMTAEEKQNLTFGSVLPSATHVTLH